jgi:hypothetical protein
LAYFRIRKTVEKKRGEIVVAEVYDAGQSFGEEFGRLCGSNPNETKPVVAAVRASLAG